MPWNAISALSSALSALVVLVAVIYAALQVKEAKTSRSIDTLLTIYSQYQSKELNLIRRQLRNGALGDLTALTDPSKRHDLDDLLNQFQLLGILVDRKYLDFRLVQDVFPNLPRTWKDAFPYVQKRRQEQSSYATFAERLAQCFIVTLPESETYPASSDP